MKLKKLITNVQKTGATNSGTPPVPNYTFTDGLTEANNIVKADYTKFAEKYAPISLVDFVNQQVVKTTGNQTVDGTKTFKDLLLGGNLSAAGWRVRGIAPGTSSTDAVNLTQLNTKADITNTVTTDTAQTISGSKTMSDLRLGTDMDANGNKITGLANATAANDAVTKTQLDTKANDNAVVKLTGNQDIGGVKAFTEDLTLKGSLRKFKGNTVVELVAPYEVRLWSDNSDIVLNSGGANKVVKCRIPLDMGSKKIIGLAAPTNDGDAVNLKYFNDNKGGGGSGDVTLAGDNAFTGNNSFAQQILVTVAPTLDQHVIRKREFDRQTVKTTGNQNVGGEKTFTSNMKFSGDRKITGTGHLEIDLASGKQLKLYKLPTPVYGDQAAPKSYVDSKTATNKTLIDTNVTNIALKANTTYVDTQDGTTLTTANAYTDAQITPVSTKVDTNETEINLRVKKTDYQSDKAEIANDLGLKAATTYVDTEIGKVNTEITNVANQIKTQPKMVGEIVPANTYQQYNQGWVGTKWYMALVDGVLGSEVLDATKWRPMNAPQQTVDLSNYDTKAEINNKLMLYSSLAGDNLFAGNNQFSEQVIINKAANQPNAALRKGEFDTAMALKANRTEAVLTSGTQTITGTKGFTSLSILGAMVANNNKITGLAPGTAGTDAVNVNQLNGKVSNGTAVTITNTQTVTGTKYFNDLRISTGRHMDANNRPIQNLPNPVNVQDATNKQYVDGITDALEERIADNEASITALPPTNTIVTTPADNIFTGVNSFRDGVFINELFIGNNGIDAGLRRIKNVAPPTADTDAATKKYVDDNSGGGGGRTYSFLSPLFESGGNVNIVTTELIDILKSDFYLKPDADAQINRGVSRANTYTNNEIASKALLLVGGGTLSGGTVLINSDADIVRITNPTQPVSLANKGYVDSAITANNNSFGSSLLSKGSGLDPQNVLSLVRFVNAENAWANRFTPSNNTIIHKKYADDNYINLNVAQTVRGNKDFRDTTTLGSANIGNTVFTGTISAGNAVISNVADPTNPQDAATRQWVMNGFIGFGSNATTSGAWTFNGNTTFAKPIWSNTSVANAKFILETGTAAGFIEFKEGSGNQRFATIGRSSTGNQNLTIQTYNSKDIVISSARNISLTKLPRLTTQIAPSDDKDLATKKYVDDNSGGLQIKQWTGTTTSAGGTLTPPNAVYKGIINVRPAGAEADDKFISFCKDKQRIYCFYLQGGDKVYGGKQVTVEYVE